MSMFELLSEILWLLKTDSESVAQAKLVPIFIVISSQVMLMD